MELLVRAEIQLITNWISDTGTGLACAQTLRVRKYAYEVEDASEEKS